MSGPVAERRVVQRRLRMGLGVWFLLSAMGGGIIMLHDDGPRLFSLSETHGPSMIDGLGIVCLVVGWVAYLVPLWKYRAALRPAKLWALVAALGAAVVVWSVATDTGAWWAAGIVILVIAQVGPVLPIVLDRHGGR